MLCAGLVSVRKEEEDGVRGGQAEVLEEKEEEEGGMGVKKGNQSVDLCPHNQKAGCGKTDRRN